MVKETLQRIMDLNSYQRLRCTMKYTYFVNICRKSHEVGKGGSNDVWVCPHLSRESQEETPSLERSFHSQGSVGKLASASLVP